MKIKQKFVVAATSIFLSVTAVLMPSENSMASTVFVDQYTSNNLVKYSHQISQKLMVLQPVVFQSVLGNLGTEQSNIFCLNQERSPFRSSIELLMRLLIIGSFGSVGIVGYSSFVERYFQIINKDLKLIYYSVFVLISLQIIASTIVIPDFSRSWRKEELKTAKISIAHEFQQF
ncbi:hypothetical protein FD724_25815 [Nostoc sp. C057]|uniref:hypothetical protein n=1 Tax=Nostoc sp. C057 TaxID=2576903 RepID=UPI0015C2E609|nr:hypothetical protein [Nostoc sp. C057]QLE51159.1 hypothetical protein FD724_25815 [Nostoc sp. C057]